MITLAFDPGPERLDQIVDECLAGAAPALAAASLTVTRQIAEPIPVYPIDRNLMKEALDCLIAEAIARAAGPARLRVTVKANRNALMFAVKAPGRGLDAAGRRTLFAEEPVPGTAARAWSIIAAHGGVAWANGESGKGVTFYFSLPMGKAADPQR